MTPILSIKRLYPDSKPPVRATDAAAGVDLYAHNGMLTLAPGAWAAIGSGIAIALPDGHVGLVCPRSGLASRHGLTVLNAPGVIDPDYTGEVKVLLINLGKDAVVIEKEMRIAQLLVVACAPLAMAEVDDLSETARGSGGFGHTGSH